MTEKSKAGSGLGIAGMILGIVGLVCAFIPCMEFWAILLCIVGIILSAISLSKAKKVNAPKGTAKAGLVTSIIGSVIAVVKYVILITAIASGASAFGDVLQNNEELQKSINDGLEQFEDAAEKLEDAQENLEEGN